MTNGSFLHNKPNLQNRYCLKSLLIKMIALADRKGVGFIY